MSGLVSKIYYIIYWTKNVVLLNKKKKYNQDIELEFGHLSRFEYPIQASDI